MKILHIFSLAALLVTEAVHPFVATAQNAPWAKPLTSDVSGSDLALVTRVVVDASNYTFVSGFLNGPATLGGVPVPVGGAQLRNGFVARLDPQGAVQWVRALAAAGSGIEADVTGLALDAAGNAVLCGSYHNGALTLGNFTLPANSTVAHTNGVVAKLSPTGNFLWAQAVSAGSTESLSTTAAAVDAAGTVYVAVNTFGTSAFAAGLGLRSFSSAGVPGVGTDYPGISGTAVNSPLGVFGSILDLVVNPTTGQLGAVGDFQGTLTLRAAGSAGPALTFTSPPEPQKGAFIAGLSTTGAPEWAQVLTSTGMSQNGRTGSFLNRLNGVIPAGNGFAVAGGYLGAGTIAGAVLPGSATSDNITGVLARLDGQGSLLWTRAISGDGQPESGAVANALATDAAGQLQVAAFFGGQLAADGGGQISAGGSDLLLLTYSPQGQLLGTQRDGSYGNEYPQALALDPTGQPRVAGYFMGTCSVGGVVVASGPRQSNGFVARLSRTPLATRANSAAAAALQVFPNPSSGGAALQVKLLPGAAPTAIQLLNVLGQSVHQQQVPARTATATVPTAGLAPGRYVLQVVNAEGVATRGVLVE
ncbi:T9SS type A sorting domain-containing protein [Hymenobacter negativus]|uniref:T9SS type A sorting domain-containing protein n=1 Tax=Hymenobacter negativus TaxID=2795026 RepID=A0ABS3QGY0_9BACT|nr:T9SS type A sorting domain-containing protein [Hymenobacter negativus]MBO2010500.1 T9SS type A sorting domain-containing protein [Hymenobacter negativus]